ncbi:hypothetical protein K523DRAFT_117120 [Schizophyllum commune Tattone D]|nr:hypothetical protein K523DRAFT_117120 [Schizophyllum commune Tattone D]
MTEGTDRALSLHPTGPLRLISMAIRPASVSRPVPPGLGGVAQRGGSVYFGLHAHQGDLRTRPGAGRVEAKEKAGRDRRRCSSLVANDR